MDRSKCQLSMPLRLWLHCLHSPLSTLTVSPFNGRSASGAREISRRTLVFFRKAIFFKTGHHTRTTEQEGEGEQEEERDGARRGGASVCLLALHGKQLSHTLSGATNQPHQRISMYGMPAHHVWAMAPHQTYRIARVVCAPRVSPYSGPNHPAPSLVGASVIYRCHTLVTHRSQTCLLAATPSTQEPSTGPRRADLNTVHTSSFARWWRTCRSPT